MKNNVQKVKKLIKNMFMIQKNLLITLVDQITKIVC